MKLHAKLFKIEIVYISLYGRLAESVIKFELFSRSELKIELGKFISMLEASFQVMHLGNSYKFRLSL